MKKRLYGMLACLLVAQVAVAQVVWMENGVFDRFFAAAIFFPAAPDDLLCFLAGVTRMRFRKFLLIILLGKPLSIALYSMGLTVVFEQLLKLM